MENTRELEALLVGFRSQYGEVYVTTIGEEEFVFRTITPKEYRELVEFAKTEDDAYERVCNTAVLLPQLDFARGKAYYPTMLAPMILEESGFGGGYKELGQLAGFRDWLTTFDAQAPIIIATAFPQYRIEDIENWTKEKIVKFSAMAEWQFRHIRGMSNFSLTSILDQQNQEGEDGEEEQEPQAEEPIDMKERAMELRRQGYDPLFVLGDLIKKPKEPFFERPIIGGVMQTKGIVAGIGAWREETLPNGRYQLVQEQVQKLSGRRRGHVPEQSSSDDD